MEDLQRQAAYLRGLLEGAELTRDEKVKPVWEGLIGFCELVADTVHDLDQAQGEHAEFMEAIDEDLGVLEKYFYQCEEDDDETDVIFTSEDKDGEQRVEITCPHCHQELSFEESTGDYEVICPECGKVVWNNYNGEVGTEATAPEKDGLN